MKRERLDWLADNSRYTQRFAFTVGRRCRTATVKDVAEELGLDWTTVKDLDKLYMAEQLRQAGDPAPKVTSVAGVQHAGVVEAGGGNVRLLKWKEYPDDWNPASDARLPVWEVLHQLIRAYDTDGDSGAAKVLAGVAGEAESARQLAYRLYTLCERAGRAEDARAYNEVVTGWSGIESAAVKVATPQQRSLFDISEAL